MAAFTNRLSELDPRLDIVMDCGEEIQKEISNDHGHDISSARRIVLDTLRSSFSPDLSGMMARIFTDTTAAAGIVPDPLKFSNAIYAVGRISRSFGFELNAYRFLAEREETGVILGCCGAPAVWAGDEDRQAANLAKLRIGVNIDF